MQEKFTFQFKKNGLTYQRHKNTESCRNNRYKLLTQVSQLNLFSENQIIRLLSNINEMDIP